MTLPRLDRMPRVDERRGIEQHTDALEEIVAAGMATLAEDEALVDATTLAEQLGVSRDYIYDHARHLGAVRIGNGPRPRLRFSLAEARAAYRQKPTLGTANGACA
jgi:hypothetical protein